MLPSSPSGSLFAHRSRSPFDAGPATRRKWKENDGAQTIEERADRLAVVRGAGSLREELSAFRADFIARDEETSRHARTLHEDVIARIALTRDGGPRHGSRRRKPR